MKCVLFCDKLNMETETNNEPYYVPDTKPSFFENASFILILSSIGVAVTGLITAVLLSD